MKAEGNEMKHKSRLADYGDILTPDDVHDILGIGYNKTYELLRTGTIRNFKIGRCRKIPKTCLVEYMNKATELPPYTYQ